MEMNSFKLNLTNHKWIHFQGTQHSWCSFPVVVYFRGSSHYDIVRRFIFIVGHFVGAFTIIEIFFAWVIFVLVGLLFISCGLHFHLLVHFVTFRIIFTLQLLTRTYFITLGPFLVGYFVLHFPLFVSDILLFTSFLLSSLWHLFWVPIEWLPQARTIKAAPITPWELLWLYCN